MMMYTKVIAIAIVIALLFAPVICEAKREHLIRGRTMGTTYHVKVVTGAHQEISGLKEKIEKRLHEINQSMSTYIKTSEISRFNNLRRVGFFSGHESCERNISTFRWRLGWHGKPAG
jgi:thiamine biosynthesis lipoprotein